MAIMWYDEENEDYVIYEEETILDKAKHTVSCKVANLGTYLVADKWVWFDAWR